jgi:hypothetical protein
MLLFYILGLTVLGFASWQDIKTESFHPQPSIIHGLIAPFFIQGSPQITSYIIFFSAVYAGFIENYIRPGDIWILFAYAATFPTLQSLFTLLTVTGIYLSLFKHSGWEKEWIPYIPAILLAYIIQFSLTLV